MPCDLSAACLGRGGPFHSSGLRTPALCAAFTMNPSVLTNASAPDVDFFRTLEVKRTQALVARDIPEIQRLHAPDYELISPPGRVMTLERYLSLMAAGPFYATWEHSAMRVRLSAEMAAIRYQAKITFPSGKVVDCWHTDVYALQAGSWKAVWSQATQLPPDLAR